MKLVYSATVTDGRVTPLQGFAAKVAVARARFKQGTVIRVTEESEPTRRTPAQNRRYWGLLVPAFSEWAGYEEFPESAEKLGLAPKDSAHAVLKSMFIGEREATLPNGQIVRVRPSTAKLTAKEMSELQDKTERFLNSQGIYLPGDER